MLRPSGRMHISVLTLVGTAILIEIESLAETVECLKSKVQDKSRLPANLQRLVFDGKQLEDGEHSGSVNSEVLRFNHYQGTLWPITGFNRYGTLCSHGRTPGN